MSASELLAAASSMDFVTDPALPAWCVLLIVFVLMAIPMGPAEPTAIVAGATATTVGLPLWLIIPVVAAGMLIGDLITFLSAGALQRRLLRRDRVRLRLRRWQTALNAQHVWRDLAVAGLRFIPCARTPAAMAARGSGLSTNRFCILAAAGATAWAAIWVGAASAVHTLPFEKFLPLMTIVAIATLVGWLYRTALTPEADEFDTIETATAAAPHGNEPSAKLVRSAPDF